MVTTIFFSAANGAVVHIKGAVIGRFVFGDFFRDKDTAAVLSRGIAGNGAAYRLTLYCCAIHVKGAAGTDIDTAAIHGLVATILFNAANGAAGHVRCATIVFSILIDEINDIHTAAVLSCRVAGNSAAYRLILYCCATHVKSAAGITHTATVSGRMIVGERSAVHIKCGVIVIAIVTGTIVNKHAAAVSGRSIILNRTTAHGKIAPLRNTDAAAITIFFNIASIVVFIGSYAGRVVGNDAAYRLSVYCCAIHDKGAADDIHTAAIIFRGVVLYRAVAQGKGAAVFIHTAAILIRDVALYRAAFHVKGAATIHTASKIIRCVA